jgi:uncharacterized damage-inducible protein DinB
MRRHFLDLFEYDRWATVRLLDFCEAGAPDSIRKLLSNFILTRELWIMRIVSGAFQQDVAQLLSWDEIRHRLEITQKQIVQFLGQLDNREFYHVLEWMPSPEIAQASLKDILSFMIQYGTSHRGRVLEALISGGATPPDLSFLTFAVNKPAPVIQWRFGLQSQ